MNVVKRVSICLACLILLAGCAGKSGGPGRYPAAAPDSRICADLVNLPQDLQVYADKAGSGRLLLDREAQLVQAGNLKRYFFQPWRASKPGPQVKKGLEANFNMDPGKGFAENLRPYGPEAWADLEANAQARLYPTLNQHAITVRNTNMRAMPTSRPYFLDPDRHGEGFPFDYFQHTALWIGTPLYVTHVSRDGLWVLAETRFSTGWIPGMDLAVVDTEFMRDWTSRQLVAVLEDNVILRGQGDKDRATGESPALHAHIGALLPLAGRPVSLEDYGRGQSLEVLYPVRAEDGTARAGRTVLPAGKAGLMPLPLTPGEVARVGNGMIGQPYGWGGLFENRDCSALVRDLYAPFGIWLPRNSASQAAWGSPVDLAGLEADEKESLIAREGVPFFSLLWLRGHICVYLGVWEDKPVMYHNIWGLRVWQDDSRETAGRAVIGKACVTTLRPGSELPDITSPASLLDRMEKLVLLPEAAKKK